MKRLIALALSAVVLSAAGSARAQDVLVEGPGVKVGEATVLHPRVGAEAGVVSNVFFEEADEVLAPVLRLLAGIDIMPSGEDRIGELGTTGARTIEFKGSADIGYTEYITSNDRARDQRNLDVNALASLVFFPQGNIAFALSDKFQRIGRPTNFESSENLDRDVNHFIAEMRVQPRGRNISGAVRYENIIDYFESDESEFANRIQHIVGASGRWKFYPYSQVWLDASFGFYGALGDNTLGGMDYKIGSNPLRILAGVDTVLTQMTTIKAYAGYANGFYDAGPSYNIVVGGIDFGWRYVPTGRLVLGYRYDVHDSINANYYGEHHGRIGVNHQVRQVFLAGGMGARFRGYRGVPVAISPEDNRDDFILEANGRASWLIQDRFSLYLDYGLQSVDTDFRTADGDDPSYIRHEAVVGAVAAF